MGNWWDNRSNTVRVIIVFAPLVALLVVVSIALTGLGLVASSLRDNTTADVGPPPTSNTRKPTSSMTGTPPIAETSTPTTPSPGPLSADASTFLDLLAALPEDDTPTSHGGYDRGLFNVWTDADGDGCNTRAEVLIIETASRIETTGRCTVVTGSWFSPYDGVWFTEAQSVDIDHFVPLKEAWVSGAWQWTASTRVAFGNDLGYPASLIAVSASSNRSKSDQDPARWLPTNTSYLCDYAGTWIAVKWRWNLSVDQVERAVLMNIVSGCSAFAVPLPEKAMVTSDPNAGSAGSSSGRGGSGDGVIEPDFGSCSVAKANGYGPYVRGVDPEYAFYRDADSDGLVCE